ncbi:Cof-type HAD-IIB family hydrolase [Nesterenkonia alba]|uniref:Cof-type HAD-IIB family hydrolase n=1 Tax=Nesterenkonia alba TaxID=515814 RepID=UPI0003B63068|nr:Cof-type HAD-IIB family hydrolase [Nesterenkonia alba]
MTDPGQPVRLIASDIDGTILPYRHTATGTLSPRTVEAFHAASEAGVVVVLVTGRPLRDLRPISETLGAVGPVIASNGALLYDLAAESALITRSIRTETLFTVTEELARIAPDARFAAETTQKLHMEEAFAAGSFWYDDVIDPDVLRIGPIDHTLTQDRPQVLKLLARTSTMAPEEFLHTARAQVGQTLTVTHSAPGVSLLEMSAKGVTKASMLQRFAERLGVAREQIVAFGDMPNDVEMLQWAGTSWAVGSAHPAARAAADYVCGDCDDDGVAQIIEQLVEAR